MLTMSVQIYSQQTTPNPNTFFLQKTEKQRKTALILLGGGAGMLVIGSAMTLNNLQRDPIGEAITINGGYIIAGIGGLAMLGSIPLFSSAYKNSKRKVILASLKNEMILQAHDRSFGYQPLPALTLKISL